MASTVDQVADTLAGLGDDSETPVRRSRALGLLADPQLALDVLAGRVEDPAHTVWSVPTDLTLYVHVSAEEFASGVGVARVEGIGPVALDRIREWAGKTHLSVRPVIDLADQIVADAYEIPHRLREQVLARDPVCVFPWCGAPHPTAATSTTSPPTTPARRRRRPTGPNPVSEPRATVPLPPPTQNPQRLALPPRPHRQLPLDQPPGPPLHRHPPRHPGGSEGLNRSRSLRLPALIGAFSIASGESRGVERPMTTILLPFAVLLLVATLLSSLANRTVLSTAALFLTAGFVLGDGVTGLVPLNAQDPVVGQLANFALFAVLFSDGMRVGWSDLRSAAHLPGRALFLGMPVTLALTALAAHYVAGLDWAASLLIGAILSPTDPVFASALVGNDKVPHRLRQLLNVESGMNDGIALPFVLIFLATVEGSDNLHIAEVGWELLLGVLIGVAVPLIAIKLERSRFFEASIAYAPLNGVAIGLLVLALATGVHGNLYLAAFAAGITVATFGESQKHAFEPFGELLAEVFKLAALLVFGALISPTFLGRHPGLGLGVRRSSPWSRCGRSRWLCRSWGRVCRCASRSPRCGSVPRVSPAWSTACWCSSPEPRAPTRSSTSLP